MNDVLALIGSPTLSSGVRRVAAAADRTVTETPAPPPRRAWLDAGRIVLDPPAALACVEELPRRTGIVLVCTGTPGLEEWQAAALIGADHVLGFPDDEVELLAVLGAATEPEAGGGTVLAVLGGCGGAGATTFAAALSWAAADTPTGVLLVDTDPFGAGLDVVTGLEHRRGVRWSGLTVESGRISARALRDAVPEWIPGVGVLAGERGATHPGPGTVTAVLDSVRRSGTTVVCDVPRTFDALADAVVAAADLTVVVTEARVGAALSAARTADWLSERAGSIGIVVRGPAPGGLRATDVADVAGLPLLASMRPQPGLAENLERGGLMLRSTSPLAVAAGTVLEHLTRTSPAAA